MAEWVAPEVRKLAEPDEFGRVFPFAVHVYYPDTGCGLVMRNYLLADAEATADRVKAYRPDARVHVSIDACG